MTISAELKRAVTDVQTDVSKDLIKHKDYKQFVCDETLHAIDFTRRIFAGTHISFKVISIILAGIVTVLHQLDWSGSETTGIIVGSIHMITLFISHVLQPEKATAELMKMKANAIAYKTTKADMPIHILHDMMQVNTWYMKHPLISTECKKEIEQHLQKSASKVGNKTDSNPDIL